MGLVVYAGYLVPFLNTLKRSVAFTEFMMGWCEFAVSGESRCQRISVLSLVVQREFCMYSTCTVPGTAQILSLPLFFGVTPYKFLPKDSSIVLTPVR